jgi:hypothetical protein
MNLDTKQAALPERAPAAAEHTGVAGKIADSLKEIIDLVHRRTRRRA